MDEVIVRTALANHTHPDPRHPAAADSGTATVAGIDVEPAGGRSTGNGQSLAQERGAYMMTATPTRQSPAPR